MRLHNLPAYAGTIGVDHSSKSTEANLKIPIALAAIFLAVYYLPIAAAEDLRPEQDGLTTQTLRSLSPQPDYPTTRPDDPANRPDDYVTQSLKNLPPDLDDPATQTLKALSPQQDDPTTQATPGKIAQ